MEGFASAEFRTDGLGARLYGFWGLHGLRQLHGAVRLGLLKSRVSGSRLGLVEDRLKVIALLAWGTLYCTG